MGSSPIRVANKAFVAISLLVVQKFGTTGNTVNQNLIYADLAHLVERHLAKVEVAGSSPVIRSNSHIGRFQNIWRYSQVVRRGSATP